MMARQALGPGDLVAVTVLLAIVGSVFVVTQAREEIRMIEARGEEGTLEKLPTCTPAANLSGKQSLPSSARRPLRRLELLNLVVLMLISQLMQALFVALMVAVFLVVLGIIVVPASVQMLGRAPQCVTWSGLCFWTSPARCPWNC